MHNELLQGTFLMMQTFANAMVTAEQPGTIINIASIVGKTGNIGMYVINFEYEFEKFSIYIKKLNK